MSAKSLTFRRRKSALGFACVALSLAGCSSIGGDGPSMRRIAAVDGQPLAESRIEVVDVDSAVVDKLQKGDVPRLFSDTFAPLPATVGVVGRGDVLEVSITEAPPAVLFGGASGDSALRNPAAASTVQSVSTGRGWTSPQQSIDSEGTIFVPFAGTIPAVGRNLREIEQTITARLRGKAHQPQVIVRRVGNSAATVTVLGEVGQSGRFPITAHGERLLEVIAAAGGPKQSLSKTLVQVSRRDQVTAIPMSVVTSDPRQNIVMQPNDTVSLLYQPVTFTALGAAGQSSDIAFEGFDFSLANALGRIRGLDPNRASPNGVFVFRFEDPAVLDPASIVGKPRTSDGKVPVVYRVDLRTPASLFLMQRFPVKHRDVIFVSQAPLNDFSRFVNIIASTVFPIAGILPLVR